MMTAAATSYRRIEHRERTAFLTTTTSSCSEENRSDTVIFAPHVAGICRSDLREIAGTRVGRCDFGHELVGTVLSTPPQLEALRGRRVVFDPHPSLTRRTSGFADLVELTADPRELAAALVLVPDGLTDPIAVFAEPLACAVHCVSRLQQVTTYLGIAPRTPVAVLGAGMAGTLICATLTAHGQPCVLMNRSRERIEFLRDRDALPYEILGASPDRSGFGRVVLATADATPEDLATALRLLAPDGLLVVFAGTRPGTSVGGLDIDRIRREQLAHTFRTENGGVIVAGTYGALRSDFREALSLLTAPPGPKGWSPAACVHRLTTGAVGLDAAAGHLNAHVEHRLFGKTLVHIRPPIPPEAS